MAAAGDVTDITTCLESVEAVRASDDVTGVFTSVDPDEHVPSLVDVVVEHLF
jgi:copper chaperone CopZ